MNNLYEQIFTDNLNDRIEYGNNKASFDYIKRQKIDKDLRILEIGCNVWTLMNMLYEDWYFKLTWIDVTYSAINYWKNKYPNISEKLFTYDWENIPFWDNEYDIVISFDVLEHIHNVEKHLQEVNRVLKKWWLYLWQTPNKLINIPWEVFINKSFTKRKTYHCSLQTLWSLNRNFRNNWFDIIIKKQNIYTPYNIAKVKNKLGIVWIILLKILSILPLWFQSNFWFVWKKIDQ